MSYPAELIPQQNYCHLKEIDSIADRHLLRWSPLAREEFYDELTGKPVSDQVVEKIRKNVKDLSTALLGNFQPEHFCYRVCPPDEDRRRYLVFEIWPQGEKISAPVREDEWETVEVGTYYHLPVNSVHNYPIPFRSGSEEFTARLVVKHTPCRTNFWHYSVRVFDDVSIDVATRYANDPRRGPSNRDDKILKAALKAIRQLIENGVPDYEPMPQELYITGP